MYIELNLQMIINIAIAVFILLQFIIIFCLMSSLSKIKKRLDCFLPKDKDKDMDIENMLKTYNENVNAVLQSEEDILSKVQKTREELQENIDSANKYICLTNEKLKNAVQKVSIIRYNPFDEVGGDLCYAIALLDDNNNGIIINSIYSRDSCYSYAKEITNGESLVHKLSEEENDVLKRALNK